MTDPKDATPVGAAATIAVEVGRSWRSGPDRGRRQGPPLCACETRGFILGDIADRPQLTSPEAAAEVVVPTLTGRDRERCVVALLDTKHRIIDVATVSVGSVDHTFMAPREVFRDALLANASALVLAHNHPSGDPEPSRDDELITRRLTSAGEIIGVDVLDHLIVGGERWVSLARRGSI